MQQSRVLIFCLSELRSFSFISRQSCKRLEISVRRENSLRRNKLWPPCMNEKLVPIGQTFYFCLHEHFTARPDQRRYLVADPRPASTPARQGDASTQPTQRTQKIKKGSEKENNTQPTSEKKCDDVKHYPTTLLTSVHSYISSRHFTIIRAL